MWKVLKEAAANWSDHQDSRQGAALAYYSVFSIGPIIFIAVGIAGLLFGKDAVSHQVITEIKRLLGDAGASAVQAMLAEANRPRAGLLATTIGLAALLAAAIGVVVQLKDALNIVWEIDEKTEIGIWHFVRNYVVSFAAVLALGFLLMVSLIITSALAAFGSYAQAYVQPWLLHLLTLVLSVTTISIIFALMFKWLPDAVVDWRDVWPGAIIAAVLFEVGKYAIAFYIGKQGLESAYGAAASIIIVLIWVYYSSQIVLFGAEITHAFASSKGSRRSEGAQEDAIS
jgi:membrane protein